MFGRGSRTSTGIAALLLATLTISVFWALQNSGPESVLRRFHRAAVNGDFQELAEVVSPDSTPQAVRILQYGVADYARMGARYQMLRMKRSPRLVQATVAYVLPNRQMVPTMTWIVEKRGTQWKVNADKTLSVLAQAFASPTRGTPSSG